MITEDYLLRMIRDMGRMVSALLGREVDPIAPPTLQQDRASGQDPLSRQLRELADLGEIDRAENLLFETLDFCNPEQFPIALDFYQHLASFSDSRLEARGYSREEILEGLRDCAGEFGVDKSLLAAFLPN